MGKILTIDNDVVKRIPILNTYVDFQTAGLTKSVEIWSAPEGVIVEDFFTKHKVAFAGTGITKLTLQFGITGQLGRWVTKPFNLLQAVGDTKAIYVKKERVEDWGAVTSILATLTAVGANLDKLSAGVLDSRIIARLLK